MFGITDGLSADLLTSTVTSLTHSTHPPPSQFLGPVFFFSFVLLATLVLLNMFIAIINNAYDVVRKEEETKVHNRLMEQRLQQFLFNVEPDNSFWGMVR